MMKRLNFDQIAAPSFYCDVFYSLLYWHDCVVCRLNYLLAGGLHPVGFHVLNIGLHCVISALMIDVFAILIAGLACEGKAKRSAHVPKASVLAALFFAAHPVHTESVSRDKDMTQHPGSSSKQTYYNYSAAWKLYKNIH